MYKKCTLPNTIYNYILTIVGIIGVLITWNYTEVQFFLLKIINR